MKYEDRAMDPLKKEDGETSSIVNENIEALKSIVPDAFTEDGINFDVLRQLLGDDVADGEEKYGLTWHGKKKARQIALTPSTGTLRPCPEESVDWDTTQNLFIEGDNLEVLKLLQKSYAGKVKMIYIDPPYNTGKEFIYPDRFQDNLETYLKYTGQKTDDGMKTNSNSESSGRYHTNWLSMMYPRLKLARSLLSEDGLIFMSIGEDEVTNLRAICKEIFGEENFVAMITWKARVKPVNIGEAKYRPQNEVEYVLIFQKNFVAGVFQPLITGSERSYPHEIEGRKYRLTTILKSNRGANRRDTMVFEVDGYTPPDGQRWQAGEDVIRQLKDDGYLEFRDGTPFKRYFEDEEGAEHDPFYCFMESDWSSTSENGKTTLNNLIGGDHGFDTVKPVKLIKTLLLSTSNEDSDHIVLDFFAGACTTSHAVLEQNHEIGSAVKFIMVQLPEPANTVSEFANVAELGKFRIRAVADKISNTNSDYKGDLGFKVFKLDSSNIRAWNPDTSDLEQTLLDHSEHLVDGRSEQDVLYELLLKRGVDLTVPIEEKEIAGKTVYSIGYGVLFACLDKNIDKTEIETLGQGITAWHKQLEPAADTQVIFRDSAFDDNNAKLNMTAILEQNGIAHVRSL